MINKEKIRENIFDLYENACLKRNQEFVILLNPYKKERYKDIDEKDIYRLFYEDILIPDNIVFEDETIIKKENYMDSSSYFYQKPFSVKKYDFISVNQFMNFCKAKLFRDEETAEKIISVDISDWIMSQNRIQRLGMNVRSFDPVVWNDKKASYEEVALKYKGLNK